MKLVDGRHRAVAALKWSAGCLNFPRIFRRLRRVPTWGRVSIGNECGEWHRCPEGWKDGGTFLRSDGYVNAPGIGPLDTACPFCGHPAPERSDGVGAPQMGIPATFFFQHAWTKGKRIYVPCNDFVGVLLPYLAKRGLLKAGDMHRTALHGFESDALKAIEEAGGARQTEDGPAPSGKDPMFKRTRRLAWRLGKIGALIALGWSLGYESVRATLSSAAESAVAFVAGDEAQPYARYLKCACGTYTLEEAGKAAPTLCPACGKEDSYTRVIASEIRRGPPLVSWSAGYKDAENAPKAVNAVAIDSPAK